MQRTRIYLVRHGQVEGHEEKRYNGQVNVPLTALGRSQSERVCDCLQGIVLDAVYSSDLDRSRYCAELIAATHHLDVVTYEALRELHIGEWEGRTWAELQETCSDDWQARLKDLVNFQVPGGESLLDAANRGPIALIPGIATASELMLGMEMGFTAFKFFPAEAAGGVPMLKSIGGPFPHITFCPTGGVSQKNFNDYLALATVACVGGSWIVPPREMEIENWDTITKLAENAVAESRR